MWMSMPVFSDTQRLKIALGGFVSFTGLLILVSAILNATGTANLGLVFQSGLAIAIASIVALLDVACGLLLVLEGKKINLFASHQKKPNNNAD